VTEAYAAGADVGRLLDDLEAAGVFLSEAHIAFRSYDYEKAISLSSECRQIVEVSVFEANLIGAEARIEKTGFFLLTALSSVFLLILLVFLGIVGWRELKKRYLKVDA